MRLIVLCALAAGLIGCASQPEVTPKPPVETMKEVAPALFTVLEGQARIMDAEGRVISSVPVDFEGALQRVGS